MISLHHSTPEINDINRTIFTAQYINFKSQVWESFLLSKRLSRFSKCHKSVVFIRWFGVQSHTGGSTFPHNNTGINQFYTFVFHLDSSTGKSFTFWCRTSNFMLHGFQSRALCMYLLLFVFRFISDHLCLCSFLARVQSSWDSSSIEQGCHHWPVPSFFDNCCVAETEAFTNAPYTCM